MFYVPILKSKAGEIRALQELGGIRGISAVKPLIEVLGSDDPSTEDAAKSVDAVVEKVARNLLKAWPSDRPQPLMVDTSYAEVDPALRPGEPAIVALLQDALSRAGVPAVPVVHLADTDELVNDVRRRVERDGLGACIRLTAEDLDDAVTPLDVSVDALARQLRLAPGDVDVVLDFGSISDANTLAMATRLSRFVLPVLAGARWRSLALASGAFPINLGEVGAYTFGQLPRYDRELWLNLSSLRLGRQLDFGDYAVTHPALQVGAAFAAPPQLRYTAMSEWLVIKGRRSDRRGHAQFYDLCRELLRQHGSVVAPPSWSWGDRYIHDAANGTAPGPGNAAIWRAIGTSQHLANVARRLDTGGAP